jgi:hypothetical protein
VPPATSDTRSFVEVGAESNSLHYLIIERTLTHNLYLDVRHPSPAAPQAVPAMD